MFAQLQSIFNKHKNSNDEPKFRHKSSLGSILDRVNENVVITIDGFGNKEFHIKLSEVKCDYEPREGDLIQINYEFKAQEYDITDQPECINITEITPWNQIEHQGVIKQKNPDYFVIGNDYVCFFEDINKQNINIDDIKMGETVECKAIEVDILIQDRKYSYRCTSIKQKLVKDVLSIPARIKIDKAQRNLSTIDFFDVPQYIKDLLSDKKKPHEVNDALDESPDFPPYEKLDHENYGDFFHNLLYLEEFELTLQMKKYNNESAYFRKEGEFLALEIDNLFESRPSIITGDQLLAKRSSNEQVSDDSGSEIEATYKGSIHKVCRDRVLIKFHPDFHDNYDNECYAVEFKHVRSQFILAHHGIVRCIDNLGINFLFPHNFLNNKSLQVNVDMVEGVLQRGDKTLKWVDTNLNEFQKFAVTQILRGELRPMPYVIYGPPGTGKTSTLIEVILQLIQNVKNCRIIVATQSNSAANHIVELLIRNELIDTENLLRIVSYNVVERNNIQEGLHKYCATIETDREEMKTNSKGVRMGITLAYLKRFKIVVGTCTGLGKMFNIGLPTSYFTHVVIDEAGQCTEPDSLIPISFVDKYSGQLILAGDPKQMGPIVLSIYARNRGFDRSLLDRLLHFPIYSNDNEKHTYDPRLVTKLLYNYRSLPSILDFCNRHFYNSELIPTISEIDSKEMKLLRRLCHEEALPIEGTNKEFGIYFCSVPGENERVLASTSWCNIQEATEIYLFIMKLLCKDVDADDIGIITPYHLQAEYIKGYLQSQNLAKLPKVGSVEEFQGLERPIILVSTVRTNSNNMKRDVARRLGFIQCPQRVNVTVSRARALLLIFGDDKLLNHDKVWKNLIDECVKNKTYMRCRRSARHN